jgi:hypothetical protein
MRNVFFLLMLLGLMGCAVTKPYQRPPAETTLAERERVYAQDKVAYHWFTVITVGRRAFNYSGPPPLSNRIARYFSSGGADDAADLARRANPYYWAAIAGALVGVASGVALYNNHPDNESWFMVPALAGLGTELFSIEWGNHRYIQPAIREYNHYIRQDLGLPPDVSPTAGLEGQP